MRSRLGIECLNLVGGRTPRRVQSVWFCCFHVSTCSPAQKRWQRWQEKAFIFTGFTKRLRWCLYELFFADRQASRLSMYRTRSSSFWGGSPTKIHYTKKGTLIVSFVLEDLEDSCFEKHSTRFQHDVQSYSNRPSHSGGLLMHGTCLGPTLGHRLRGGHHRHARPAVHQALDLWTVRFGNRLELVPDTRESGQGSTEQFRLVWAQSQTFRSLCQMVMFMWCPTHFHGSPSLNKLVTVGSFFFLFGGRLESQST